MFAVEAIEQSFNSSSAFNRKMVCQLVRVADLAANMVLEIELTKSGPTYYPAEALLQEVSFTVGSSTYDKHFPLWFRAFDTMYRNAEQKAAYRRLVDFAPEDPIGCRKKFYVPLLFTFNRFYGCALPIIGLEFHDLYLNLTVGAAPQGIDPTQPPDITLYTDYVYLGQEEREKFATGLHEYLIDQVQFTGSDNAFLSTSSSKSQQVRLTLNHPVKSILWCLGGAGHGVFTAGPAGTTNDSYAPLRGCKMTLNGADRMSRREGMYFSQMQPFQTEGASPVAGIYTYNFALSPRDYQPSGHCNFSRIENATMSFDWKQISTAATAASQIFSTQYVPAAAAELTELNIFAWNYNVLRVTQGMGGILFVSILGRVKGALEALCSWKLF